MFFQITHINFSIHISFLSHELILLINILFINQIFFASLEFVD